jgi:hypothetical protein
MPNFNTMLRNKDMNLLRNYAIHPDDDVMGYLGDSVDSARTTLQTVPGSYKSGVVGAIQKKLAKVIPAFKPKSTMRFTKTISHNQVAAGKKVAWVNLTKRGGDRTGNEGSETIDVRGSFDYRKHWVPVYFLPWDAGGAIVSMTIPREGVIGPGSHILDPDIFFTAAINGCSIFIQGSPENPTVYHAGGDTGRGNDMARGAGFWRDVLTNFADLSKGKFQTEINKMDYIKTPGQVSKDGALTTANAKAYRQWLEDKYKTTLDIQLVSPWGAVCGFRNDGKWKFYLQENATIAYLKLNKKTGPQNTKLQIVSRPMVVREIFPASQGGANMNHPLPIKVTTA